jgi:UDP-3-O-[3-hydroxymyristoyl] glucosamine N-acyltransferase
MSALEQTAAELAVLLDGQVVGNPDVRIRRLAKIESAGPGAVSFLSNPEYERFIYSSSASVVIVSAKFQPAQPLPKDLTLLKVDDPYRAFARLLEAYDAVLKPLWTLRPPLERVVSSGLASWWSAVP